MPNHQPTVDAHLMGKKWRQAMAAVAVEHPIDATFGNRPHLGQGDCQEVRREPEWRAMEVPARLDPPIIEHHRIVDRRRKLVLNHRPHMHERVARRAMNRWCATDRVCVLYPWVVRGVTRHDRRVSQHRTQIGGTHLLPRLRSEFLQEQSTLDRFRAELEREKIQARKAQVKSRQTIDLADVKLTAAEREMRRAEESIKTNAISEIDYERARDELARARVEQS